ncbi:Spermidine/putrescine-binding periplasmic protein 1 [Morella rubra]|uniref:Spermidine/putrescine-binding periplasmic protein 1 n=1 Tax=Morella rubra TaxID=262757 RepID=A0A6A1VTZ4_9ROSI|nr:Spermidine/putrescine-binding periplasmic protein 1 [Morella rubra]
MTEVDASQHENLNEEGYVCVMNKEKDEKKEIMDNEDRKEFLKDFIQSQGKRLRFNLKYNASLEGIFSDLSMPSWAGQVLPSSTLAADIVSVGDSWLNFAITKALIEPMEGVEDQEWFKGLGDKWKDWADLWRPELEGKISMVDSPREVAGAVLKYMGASYNTNNLDLEVAGGKSAVQKNLQLLRKQVRLFDSVNYLKAFAVGDVWVAVGWSSDVIPIAKRTSDVTVIVPKSGASLWADLWAIPAVSRFETNRIGGRVRGPSPLTHQWIEFCLQAARALPFKQEVIPGASPAALGSTQIEVPTELTKGKPRLDTNLIAGVPPPEILARCEFLEPLSDSALSDYQWLISTMQEPNHGFVDRMHHHISLMQKFWLNRKLH